MGIFPLVFLLGNQVCRNISDQSLNIMQKHRKYEYEYEFFLVKNKVTGIFQKLKIIFSCAEFSILLAKLSGGIPYSERISAKAFPIME